MEIKSPEVFEPHTLEFWEDVILGEVVVRPKAAFEPIGGEDDVLGVGDAPEEDEKESLPLPEDDEINDMARSASEEYQIAH
jgi:hypothetical protein